MKRKIEILLLSLILTVVVTVGISSTTKGLVIQPGDVNGDGEINAVDLVLLSQYIAGWDVILGGDSHTVVIDPAVPATCTQTGLTEGKHCSDCGMILVKQQIVPTTEHDYEETVVQPTTATQGYTLCKCKVCGYEQKKDFIPPVNSNGLAVEVNTANMTCVITGIGTCTDTDINIPAKISGYTVVGIADKAFSEQTQITSITLPNTVKTLGQRAFYGCTGLTEFTVPASVTSVGHQVFYKCDNLATVYYNSSFSPDQDKVFLNIPSIKTVVFGGVYVPNRICYNCSNIENVTVKDSVTSIGWYAFDGCSSLTSVEIGDSVTSIGWNAFRYCSSLTNLYISDLESWLNASLSDTLSNPLCSAGGNLYIDGVLATDIKIPDSVTSIGYSSFYGCSSLTSVEIPDSVTSIGNYAFENCSSLTNLYIFDLESWLNVKLSGYDSNPLSSAGGNLYIDGVLATDIKIPDTITSIGNYKFIGCSSLTSVEIPDSVTSIGDSAFGGCSSLTSVVVPDSVTSIGDSAFRDCSSLTNLYISDLESWLNVSLSDSYSHPLYYAGGNLYIDGVLATDIRIPDSVTSIGDSAFSGCSSLTSVEIGDSVTSIGVRAFRYCSSLISVEIPDSVTSIGEGAFSGCSSLKSITLPFVGGSRTTSSDTYQYPFGYIFGTSSYTGGVKTTQFYYGSSTSSTSASTYYIPSSLKHVTITGGNILYGAFYNCSSLTSVEIPDSVTSIGDYAFEDCSSLTSVEIPDSVTSIGSGAFLYCSSLTSVEIPDSVTSIGEYGFYYCSRLTSVEIGDSVTIIGDWAFSGCSSLTSVEIPDSVTSIGWCAFERCSSLTSVYYGGDATKWAEISFGSSVWTNTPSSRKVYYYSATQLTTTGNYWRYVDGKPTPW